MKLVPEKLNEYHFERGLDSKEAMGVGIYSLSPEEQKKIRYRENYRRRGSVSSRTTHDFGKEEGYLHPVQQNYSRGYALYKVLQLIKDAGPEGLRRKDIVKFLYERKYGPGTFTNKYLSWGNTTYFIGRQKMLRSKKNYGKKGKFQPGFIKVNTNKTEEGRYAINQKGLETIEKYRKLFNE